MSVLFCDTDCELWYTKAQEMNLGVIQMPYTIDGQEYLYDLGEHTDFKQFFGRMRDGAAPITSAQNEQYYIDMFEPYYKAGEDILYIAFSSKMSGTFNQLDKAIDHLSKLYPTVRFRRFDTLNICMGAGFLVWQGAKFFAAHSGDIDATYDYLSSILNKVCILFVVEDMKYLARGGRITPAKAKIGNFMQIKPVLSVGEAGEIDVRTKQNGSKKAMSYLLNEVFDKYLPYDDAPITVVGADCDDTVEYIAGKIAEKFPDATIWKQPIGPVIGAHAGPGTYGVIFPSVSR